MFLAADQLERSRELQQVKFTCCSDCYESYGVSWNEHEWNAYIATHNVARTSVPLTSKGTICNRAHACYGRLQETVNLEKCTEIWCWRQGSVLDAEKKKG